MPDLTYSTSIPSFDSNPSNINLPTEVPISDTMKMLKRQKKSAKEFQDRRRTDWDDNYELYRNKVFTNRLTQRQAVNIPLIKETIKTILSKIDDPPNVNWKELSGDRYKELLLQEIWNDDYDRQNFEAVDMQDKKTVLLYGRGFRKLNWTDKGFEVSALDIFDVVVDPLTDPLDLETARFVIHQNIFRSLRDLLADDRYEKAAKDKLKVFLVSKEGLIQSDTNRKEWERKMRRIQDMGVDQSEFPLFAGGDVIVNLTEHYCNIWDKSKKKFVRHVVVYANDSIELLDWTLKEAIGVEFYPFITWGDDLETQDFWSDSIADLCRTPNKILNVWFSQLIENRTLRNFQMHWYDSSNPGYIPQTYEPGPGRMLPAPPTKQGQSIKDVVMPVDISGLDETFGAVDFLTKIVEKATASGSLEKGQADKKQETLGEIKTVISKSLERTISMMKWYRRAWREFAEKWYQMKNANQSTKIKLYKTAASGKIWPITVYPSDWKSEFGFKAVVRSTSEQEEENSKGIQKFMFLVQQFPNNTALKKIAQKRMLEMVDMTPEEMREIEEVEKKLAEAGSQPNSQVTPTGRPQPTQTQPQVDPALLNEVNQKISQLNVG